MQSKLWLVSACALTVGLLASSGSAYSADLGGPRGGMKDGPVVERSVPTWTGFYAGIQSGYTWGNADHSFGTGGMIVPGMTANSAPDGLIYGGHVGYNLQSGSIVYGIEADLEGGDVRGGFAITPVGGGRGDAELNWQGSVRARLGYVDGSALFYATAGWVIGGFDFGGGPAGAPLIDGYSKMRNGWTIGAGAEWMLSRRLTMRIEYRYADYGEASGLLLPTYGHVYMPVDLDTHTVRAGLSLRF